MNEPRHAGVGITPRELRTGTSVMVPVGAVSAAVNGGPCLIAWAVVRGLAENPTTEGPADPADAYWLDVYLAPGRPPVPQVYRAGEILGIPAAGLRMDGAP